MTAMMMTGGGDGLGFMAAPMAVSSSSVSAKEAPQPSPVDVEEITDWLKEIYKENDDLRDMYQPDDWQDFIDEVE